MLTKFDCGVKIVCVSECVLVDKITIECRMPFIEACVCAHLCAKRLIPIIALIGFKREAKSVNVPTIIVCS